MNGVSFRSLGLLASLLLLLLVALPAQAQSNQFRDARAHLGVAVGAFTYHGPIDLRFPRSANNFVRETDVGVVLLGSFPITQKRIYFRGMIGLSNFDTSDGEALVGNGLNEFLVKQVLWFEPEVVFTLNPHSRSRFLLYAFTGFGGFIADPFSENIRVDRPGTGVPGPERSTFTLPVGLGFDIALTRRLSVFAEGSWRFDLNYVLKNEANYHPHSTSLVLGGLRIGLHNPFKRNVQRVDRALPPPMEIPNYIAPEAVIAAPAPRPMAAPRQCPLVDLNTIYFAYNSSTLDAEGRARLNENIEALRMNPDCCVNLVGFTDSFFGSGDPISMLRAQIVYNYYVNQGISPDRLRVIDRGLAFPSCEKDEEGPGCRRNRRVESLPLDCDTFIRQINR